MFASVSRPIRSNIRTNHESLARARFPALLANNKYLLGVHIGSVYCLCFLCDWQQWILLYWFYNVQLKTRQARPAQERWVSQWKCPKTSKGPGKRGHIVADTLLPTQMFPRLPARATFVADTNFVSATQKMSDLVQKHFVSATNVSQFAQPKKHHGQQCVRNNESSFARALTLYELLQKQFRSKYLFNAIKPSLIWLTWLSLVLIWLALISGLSRPAVNDWASTKWTVQEACAFLVTRRQRRVVPIWCFQRWGLHVLLVNMKPQSWYRSFLSSYLIHSLGKEAAFVLAVLVCPR